VRYEARTQSSTEVRTYHREGNKLTELVSTGGSIITELDRFGRPAKTINGNMITIFAYPD
jgi:hypothetical protein